MVVGDQNSEINLECMTLFYKTYEPSNLFKMLTCYKNPEKPSSIDLLLTNRPESFLGSSVIQTGLSDFHKMTVTVMKTNVEKFKPRVSFLRNWNEFYDEKFRTQLLTKLLLENFSNSSNNINDFLEICVNTLDILPHPTPRKNTCREITCYSLVKTKCFFFSIRVFFHGH